MHARCVMRTARSAHMCKNQAPVDSPICGVHETAIRHRLRDADALAMTRTQLAQFVVTHIRAEKRTVDAVAERLNLRRPVSEAVTAAASTRFTRDSVAAREAKSTSGVEAEVVAVSMLADKIERITISGERTRAELNACLARSSAAERDEQAAKIVEAQESREVRAEVLRLLRLNAHLKSELLDARSEIEQLVKRERRNASPGGSDSPRAYAAQGSYSESAESKSSPTSSEAARMPEDEDGVLTDEELDAAIADLEREF